MKSVQLNEQFKRSDFITLDIELNISTPLLGSDPGPKLLNMHISPDFRWMVTDFAYLGSKLISSASSVINMAFPRLGSAKSEPGYFDEWRGS